MSKIFGRDRPHHAFDKAIAEWRASRHDIYKSMACNIVHDHRVSPEREEDLRKLAGDDCTGIEFGNAIRDYFETKIKFRPLPAYVYWKSNKQNLLGLTPWGWKGPKRDTKLLRILDISGLFFPFAWAKKQGRSRFATLNDREEDAPDWVDKQLKGLSADAFEAFLEEVLVVIRQCSEEQSFQPVWATTLNGFQDYALSTPDRWLEPLGMTRASYPRWLVLLAYDVKEAGTLARPCQLEAGFNPVHYPSPECADVSRGGHPVDLRPNPLGNLLGEYVHKEIPHTLKHFENAGKRYGPTSGTTPDELRNQRERHYERLVGEYGSSPVRAWMSRSDSY